LVHQALKDFVNRHKRRNVLELVGQVEIEEDYDYKALRRNDSYANAARIYFDCRRKGVAIRSTLDCLIAEIAMEHNLILLHDDVDFCHMATVITDLKIRSE